MSDSMMSAAGGGHLSAGILNESVQHVSQRYQIIHGYYNAGAHYGFPIASSISEHDPSIGSYMRKSQGCEGAGNRNIDLPIAQSFWHVIRVGYGRLCRLVSHR
jgi:hypothetical protein